jgi:very-short-patch-repair endonuclease
LIIEVDGGQHLKPDHPERDRQRDRCLCEEDLLVLRFDNRAVLPETDAVLGRIGMEVLRRMKSPPTPLS